MSSPIVLVVAWAATDDELHECLPGFVLDVLRDHEDRFDRRKVSVSIGVRDDAAKVQELIENWKQA